MKSTNIDYKLIYIILKTILTIFLNVVIRSKSEAINNGYYIEVKYDDGIKNIIFFSNNLLYNNLDQYVNKATLNFGYPLNLENYISNKLVKELKFSKNFKGYCTMLVNHEIGSNRLSDRFNYEEILKFKQRDFARNEWIIFSEPKKISLYLLEYTQEYLSINGIFNPNQNHFEYFNPNNQSELNGRSDFIDFIHTEIENYIKDNGNFDSYGEITTTSYKTNNGYVFMSEFNAYLDFDSVWDWQNILDIAYDPNKFKIKFYFEIYPTDIFSITNRRYIGAIDDDTDKISEESDINKINNSDIYSDYFYIGTAASNYDLIYDVDTYLLNRAINRMNSLNNYDNLKKLLLIINYKVNRDLRFLNTNYIDAISIDPLGNLIIL